MKKLITILAVLIGLNTYSQVYIPNAFTPNNDGYNDYFAVITTDTLVEFNLRIFNLWGELVFYSSDPNEVWLGGEQYYNADGMYVFILIWRREDEVDEYIEKGHILLSR
jgi:gliding motility-associated-like protein